MCKRILVFPTAPELGITRPLWSLAHAGPAYATAAVSPPGPAA